MKPVYVVADNIFSPIGPNTETNFQAVIDELSGIREIDNTLLSKQPFFASAFENLPVLNRDENLTRFETLCMASIQSALLQTSISLADKDTIFILASTKGNIELIENTEGEDLRNKLSLSKTARHIASYFQATNHPLVVSNACISGVAAIILACRLLQSGQYKHAVVTGTDVVSRFVVSGFQCLYAMSDQPCKPFDKMRKGINLGECAATMVLTTNLALSKTGIVVNEGAITNDANHISGPSRTGKELSFAIETALKNSGIDADQLSFISAHGTATVHNDEMESKAFTLSRLNEIPLHSLKGNFGHTLGAAGILESILTYRSLPAGIILPSKNFEELGVPEKITVNTSVVKSDKRHALKTASGFGGCNAAIVYSMM